jgi:hypothetical protein
LKGAFPEKGDTGQVRWFSENREVYIDKTKNRKRKLWWYGRNGCWHTKIAEKGWYPYGLV